MTQGMNQREEDNCDRSFNVPNSKSIRNLSNVILRSNPREWRRGMCREKGIVKMRRVLVDDELGLDRSKGSSDRSFSSLIHLNVKLSILSQLWSNPPYTLAGPSTIESKLRLARPTSPPLR